MYRILIAEDELLVRIGFRNMFNWEELDMVVVSDVSNGKDALEAYEKFAPDILITDLRMPIMDGMTLIKKIREKDKRIQIIILTCLDEFNLVQDAISLGVSSYILKLTTSLEEIKQIILNCATVLDTQTKPPDDIKWIDHSLIGEQLLSDLISTPNMPIVEFDTFVTHFHLKLSPQKLCLVRMQFQLNAATEHIDVSDRKHRRIIMGILNKIFSDVLFGEPFYDYPNNYILLFSFPQTDSDEITSLLTEILKNVQETFEALINMHPVFGISNVSNGYETLSSLYETATILLNSNELLPLKVDAALDYLKAHYYEPISLQIVADYIGVTPNYLSHLLVRYTEMPFTDTLNNIRIENAKKLLFNLNSSVNDVSEQVGFSNTAYFIRVFKKMVGLTPNDYREKRGSKG